MIQQMGRRLISKQTCCFLGRNTLVTFQDSPEDVFGPVRQRIENARSRLRANDASFLLYSLLHATVDAFFPLLEKCAERIEDLEKRVLARPTQTVLRQIHRLRRDIVTVRRVAWPMRELILELRHEPHECFSANTRIYLREVHDHKVRAARDEQPVRGGVDGEVVPAAGAAEFNFLDKVISGRASRLRR